jgi:hypothetical protein
VVVKERPILFNVDMVRAILAGRKTQTRRVVKPQPIWVYDNKVPVKPEDADPKGAIKCPYGKPGDRLWVRETFAKDGHGNVWYREGAGVGDRPCDYFEYPDGSSVDVEIWTPSIHMPRWASRITLEIVSVRVERLLSISDEDAIAEGCYTDDEYSDMAGGADVWPCQICDGYQVYEHGSLAGASEVDCHSCNSPKKRFSQLWQSINGFDSWDANPWVWVVEFRRVEQ